MVWDTLTLGTRRGLPLLSSSPRAPAALRASHPFFSGALASAVCPCCPSSFPSVRLTVNALARGMKTLLFLEQFPSWTFCLSLLRLNGCWEVAVLIQIIQQREHSVL